MNSLITSSFKACFKTSLLLSLLMNSGCFYFIEEGKGGVAERFPIQQPIADTPNKLAINFPKRFDKCKKRLVEYQNSPLNMHHPVRFHKIAEMLVISQRMHEANFYRQASHYLGQAEKSLTALQSKVKQSKPVFVQPKAENVPKEPTLVSF